MPPRWLLGTAAGAGAGVAEVAVQAALALLLPSWRGRSGSNPAHWVAYVAAGLLAASGSGPPGVDPC